MFDFQNLINFVASKVDKFAIFETLKQDDLNFTSYIFYQPVEKLVLFEDQDVKRYFLNIENFLNKGFYVVGFFSYELGYYLDYQQTENFKYIKDSFPLALFYVFHKPIIFDHRKNLLINFESKFFDTNFKINRKGFKIKNFRLNIDKMQYFEDINKIKKYIKNGDTYQINYTVKAKFNIEGSELDFYNKIKNFQKVSYAAYIKTEDYSIISFSPELFFRKDEDVLYVKPMKGTIQRGKTLYEDLKYQKILKRSKKDKAENVMIVDLLRNDLGKISPYGEVEVEKLFEVEKYETLFQMTSTIKTKTYKNLKLYDLFKALFPSGSVTGAPKIRSMQIINELEKQPRKVYTGAIGFFTPDNFAEFNVAIRTVLVYKNKSAEIGIGSGIVDDSLPPKEFEECKLKANFLFRKHKRFKLLETILYNPSFDKIDIFDNIKLNINTNKYIKNCLLLNYHIKRLEDSALYFGFKFNKEQVLDSIFDVIDKVEDKYKYRLRVLLSEDGKLEIQVFKLDKFSFCAHRKVKVKLLEKYINGKNVFFYHKTTNRYFYSYYYNKFKKLGYFDVLFQNRNGFITETSRCNVFIDLGNGKIITPPIECGLLGGVFRKLVLENNDVEEREISVYEILKARNVYLTNSVVGIIKADVEV
ncbi:MAG: aminodeoxychorismate synthase component I [Endomicrobia bacterium]|nr:aminodeoxychorismate synthase component I [Endomicrobiia bacterium]